MEELTLTDAQKKVGSLRQRIAELNGEDPDHLYTQELIVFRQQIDEVLAKVFPDSSRR